MKPRIFKIDPYNIDHDLLKQAVAILHNRGLVAFPTETVYGLGANALDPRASAGIFEAKERPLDDPLIVHISEKDDLYRLTKEVPTKIQKLIDLFWPGPLTVVLEKTDLVPDIVTTGLMTVAVRMPRNSIARKFIELAGVPIAAPSANIFGRPSPTTAKHVLNDLKGKIDVILDGGRTEIGVESTVVKFQDGKVVVLRPGGVDIEDLQSVAGDVTLASETSDLANSPGKYPQHYSPSAKVVIVGNDSRQSEKVLLSAWEMKSYGLSVGILAKQEHADKYRKFKVKVLGPQNDARTCATRLFHMLREFDAKNVDVIISEAISEKGIGLAVMNRLRKAAGPADALR
ncbi:MAG: threonylcarbamoyl-AMP synthase [Candidatus Omnitrophica bacterium]|nr:threonylcarbamoyl-AMP synthase [Candidatus Omnitrophota bacterium]MBU1894494.1 threonylcarbamoyl-AMP synthase [Candidatus Omnitrophota bacterium]